MTHTCQSFGRLGVAVSTDHIRGRGKTMTTINSRITLDDIRTSMTDIGWRAIAAHAHELLMSNDRSIIVLTLDDNSHNLNIETLN